MGTPIGNYYCPATFDWMEKPGDRIRTMRKALGWNQSRLAEEIGVDQSTVSDIERGAGFAADLLMRLAEKLGASAELVMQGSDKRVWPFPKVPLERFTSLDPEDRGYVQRKLLQAIEDCEQEPASLTFLKNDEDEPAQTDLSPKFRTRSSGKRRA